MEAKELLTVDADADAEPAQNGACPKCGEGWGPLAPVEATALEGVQIRRCGRCGTRATIAGPRTRLLVTCDGCGLPFLDECPDGPEPRRCERCSAEAATAPEAEVVEATEAEVRRAIEDAWRFVATPALNEYFERVVREMRAHVTGVPDGCRVVLLDEPSFRTLVLPSGVIILSLGLLRFLEDEAELVFVLGRELTFLASGEASARLVRGGFRSVAREDEAEPETAWKDAVADWVRLGYGRRRELDADARSLRLMLALRYDPTSALRLLRRLRLAIESGDKRTSEIAVAQLPPGYRIRKLERVLYGRVGRASVQRVNREVFRRAVGSASGGSGDLRQAPLDSDAVAGSDPAPEPARPLRRGAAAAIGIALLAAILVLLGMMLRG